MNQFLKRAKELESQLQADRRYLHQHAEAGENLPNTTKYVMERLREIGLNPIEICPSGVTALIEGCLLYTSISRRYQFQRNFL